MFNIENIDRAIEWALRDEFVRLGLWPDQRAFIAANDEDGYNAALAAMATKVDVFGVGNYTDREQLRRNNLIIERTSIEDGDIAFGNPLTYTLRPDKTYDKVQTPEGTHHIIYRLRFVCWDVELDRKLNLAIINALSRRKTLNGMNDDLTNMEETFDIFRYGSPADLSGNDFIERVYDYIVRDVILEDDIVIDNVPPTISITPVMNAGPRGYDVRYPDPMNDLATNEIKFYDYIYHLFLEAFPLLAPFDFIRFYAHVNEAMALKNLCLPGHDAVNTGLTFSPFKGFTKTAAGQYLNTNWSPMLLTSFSYSVFTLEIPTTGIFELFGLENALTSFYLKGQSNLQSKANSNVVFTTAAPVKPFTLYTLNRKNRFAIELWEGNKQIGYLQTQPTDIPVGDVFELNSSDDTGLPIGVSTGGGLAFSCAGEHLKGSQIELLNDLVRKILTKLGTI